VRRKQGQQKLLDDFTHFCSQDAGIHVVKELTIKVGFGHVQAMSSASAARQC
jgi:hypothetical protein